MRKTILAFAVAAALVAGCSSHKTTVDSNGTTVTTSGDNSDQTVTVQSKEGTAVAGKGAVNAASASLGLPVYPGATAQTGYTGSNAQSSGALVELTTKDSFDKVYAWYKGQLPAGAEKIKTSSASGDMAVFQVNKEGEKTQKVITITASSDGTMIQLAGGTSK